MKIIKPPLSIRLIHWFNHVVLGLLSLVTLGAIVFNILLYTNFFGDDIQLRTSFPAKVNFMEKGDLYLHGDHIKVQLVDASSRIHFIDTPDYITKKAGIALLIVLFMILFLVWEFRQFVLNVKKGDVFTKNNIHSLHKIAYILVGIWIFIAVYMRLAYSYLNENIHFENIVITNEIPNYKGLLFVALFVWVLAHIMMSGLKIKEEQELTI